jgi:peroxiredoxin
MPKLRPAIAALAVIAALVPLARAAELPRKSPDFTVNLNTGKQLRVSDYRGKALVIAFILTTCPHCQHTVGLLSKQQNELGRRGLQVVACAVERGASQNVPGFIRTFNPSFPVGYQEDGAGVMAYLQHPEGQTPYMPMLVFIDRRGVIRAQYTGRDPFIVDEAKQEQNLRAEIETLLKSVPPVKKKR